jgi:hypothetical protein
MTRRHAWKYCELTVEKFKKMRCTLWRGEYFQNSTWTCHKTCEIGWYIIHQHAAGWLYNSSYWRNQSGPWRAPVVCVSDASNLLFALLSEEGVVWEEWKNWGTTKKMALVETQCCSEAWALFKFVLPRHSLHFGLAKRIILADNAACLI